ncbi:MAG: IS1182 family transposase [Archaeoglobaceae archaeon]
MSKTYRSYEQSQNYLLPPDIRDWLPDDHLAVYINNLVEELDLSKIYGFYESEGRGYPPYHPAMMVKVLLYAYCIGTISSRKINKSLYDDVAFRYLSANNFPDFRTICAFRKRHLDVLEDLFLQVLKLCEEAGLVKLGAVSLDGSKVKGNASLSKSKKYGTLCKKEEELEKKVKELLEQAERTDEEEDELYGDRRGDELPEGFRSKKEQLERIKEAKRQLEEEQRKEQEEYQKKLKEREEKENEGKKLRGRKPKEPDKKKNKNKKDKKRNTTDPDSRVMKTRNGFLQGYNAQVVVDADTQVIVATDLVQDENDKHQQCMLYRVEQNLGRRPDKGLMDNGYWDEERLKKLEESGIELYVATEGGKEGWKKLKEGKAPRGRIPKNATYKERMERKLLTKKGKKIYEKRRSSVEPVIGQIKNRIVKLLLRGLKKAKGEWNLIATSHNILKLWRAESSHTG